MIRVSEETYDRVTELSYKLDLSRAKTVEFLMDSFEKKVKQAVYVSLGTGKIKTKPLVGKKLKRSKLNKVCNF